MRRLKVLINDVNCKVKVKVKVNINELELDRVYLMLISRQDYMENDFDAQCWSSLFLKLLTEGAETT